jgi:uncharacterized membrane protein
MIIMALDHVRDYFHADAFLFDPTDMTKTNVPLFFTRWITHFCAPVFIFLAGTSAYMVGAKKGKKELSSFLFKRGLWLVFLEVTVINFAWLFNVEFSLILLVVIWALGMGMIVLAGAIHLPFKVIVGIGLVMVLGHNLLDGIHVQGDGADAMLWSVVHQFAGFKISENFVLLIAYPLVPWIGVMMLGYCFGVFYSPSYPAASRKKNIMYLGLGSLALFVVVRFINGYGDPQPWEVQSSPVFTFLSFLNVTKYPPSLLYLLVTLGPAFLLLAVSENYSGAISQRIKVLGRVPMFYYLLHLYLIHLLAVPAAMLIGYQPGDMIFDTWVTNSSALKGYGFSLGVVYIVWLSVILILYPLCEWYDRYKTAHRDKWWLSYL